MYNFRLSLPVDESVTTTEKTLGMGILYLMIDGLDIMDLSFTSPSGG